MSYTPDGYTGYEDLPTFLNAEFEKIQEAFAQLFDGEMYVRNFPPVRPRNGVYYADGTNWNPGSGRGIYRFDESLVPPNYVFLG